MKRLLRAIFCRKPYNHKRNIKIGTCLISWSPCPSIVAPRLNFNSLCEYSTYWRASNSAETCFFPHKCIYVVLKNKSPKGCRGAFIHSSNYQYCSSRWQVTASHKYLQTCNRATQTISWVEGFIFSIATPLEASKNTYHDQNMQSQGLCKSK